VSSTLLQALQYIDPVQVTTCPRITTHTNPRKYKYKYNTPVEAGYPNQGEDIRLNTNTMKMSVTPESYAHELRNRKTPKREANGGLAPWWPPALGLCATTWGGQEGWSAQGGGKGEGKGDGVGGGVGEGNGVGFRRSGKEGDRDENEMILEVEVVVMGVVLWW